MGKTWDEMSESERNELRRAEEEWEAKNRQRNPLPKPTNKTTEPETAQPRRTRYNWAAWQDGKYHELVRGEDFDIAVTKFRMQVYQRALGDDLEVRTETKGLPKGHLGVMFAKDPETLEREWKRAEEVEPNPTGWFEADE